MRRARSFTAASPIHQRIGPMFAQWPATASTNRDVARCGRPDDANKNLTDVGANWKTHRPKVLPMPHPSPRNQRWLREKPWFEREVLPTLKVRVRALLNDQG